MLQKFGGCMLRIFWGAYSKQNQVGDPGQMPSLPMLMTTTASLPILRGLSYSIFLKASVSNAPEPLNCLIK